MYEGPGWGAGGGIREKTYDKGKKNKGPLSLCWVLKTCCAHELERAAVSLPQGTNPFPSGLAAQTQDSSSCRLQKKLGFVVFLIARVSSRVAARCPRRAGRGGMRSRASPGKSAAVPNRSKKCPTVCSALRTLGEVQGGEVNIVRRGGASPGAQPPHASHPRGPGQLSPSRTRGPCRHL